MKSMSHRTYHQEVISGLKEMLAHQCPLTSGLPTSMTLKGFRARCEGKQEENSHIRCEKCQGADLPPELTILALADFNQPEKEKHMTREKKQGTCDYCAKKRKVHLNKGQMVCVSCELLRNAANKDPELLIKAVKEFHPEALPKNAPADTAKLEEELAITIAENGIHIEEIKRLKALQADKESEEKEDLVTRLSIAETKLAILDRMIAVIG